MAEPARYPNRLAGKESNTSSSSRVKMTERKDPVFVQFSDGDVVEGILTNVERIEVSNKPVTRFTVKQDDGELCSFLGTYQINSKLRPSDRGHRVSVRCEGSDSNVTRNGNAMKVFRVYVSDDPLVRPVAATEDPTQITDDDIPF